uniref:Uncharacterized protein n=1 Tax=Biomphalaria glabrata TaxID=6526 RepID=A0A2C9LQC0_BIOGL
MLTRQVGSRIISPQRQVTDTDGKPKEQIQNLRLSVGAQRRMSLSSQTLVAVQQDDLKSSRSPKSAQAVQDEKKSVKQDSKKTHACTKCKNKCIAFWLALISNFLLLFLVAAYSVMGGFLFQFLELKKHALPKDQFQFMEYRRMTTVYKLLGISRINTNLTMDIGYQWAESLDKVLEEYQLMVMEETGRQIKAEKIEWTFMSSIMYSVTLITSIVCKEPGS